MKASFSTVCLGGKFQLKTITIAFSFVFIFSKNLTAAPLEVGVIWFPPFYNIEKKEEQVTKISGINVDIVTRVLDRIGESYELKFYPAKRLYSNMVRGKTHIFYGIRVPASHVSPDHILHSKTKISKITLKAYYLNQTARIASKTDLIGKTVIVFRGYGYGGFIEYIKNPNNRMSVFEADSQINGFKMILKKRAEYLIAFERPATNALKAFGKSDQLRITSSEPLFVADGYFIVSRKVPDAEKLLERMEKAYLDLETEGAFKGMIVE